MSARTHIHEVIFLIQENDGIWNEEQLLEGISNKWGEDVQFSSCSGVPFPKEEALQFLLDRNKVVLEEGIIGIHPAMKMCNSHLQ